MWEPLGVHGDMPLDTRDLLARIVALLFSGIGVPDALRINYAEARPLVPPKVGAGRAN